MAEIISAEIVSSTARRVDLSMVNGVVEPIHFSANADVLGANSTALLALTLLPGLASGKNVQLEGAVSPAVLRNLDSIQDIYTAWSGSLRRVSVRGVTPASGTRQATGRVGAFFSGGLDSFYTVLKHRDEITHLIFLKDFDGDTEDARIQELKLASVRAVAAELNKELIEIDSNARSMLRKYVRWGPLGYGPMLYATALMLSEFLDRVYIAAAVDYANPIPCAVHPLLDPLWNTESFQFIHSGCEATRVGKARFIADYEVAMRHLRVCFMHAKGAFNCGTCEKCVRTQLNFLVAGKLEKLQSFTVPFSLASIRRIRARTADKQRMMRDNLRLLAAENRAPEVQRAIEFILKRSSPTSLETRLLPVLKRNAFLRRVVQHLGFVVT